MQTTPNMYISEFAAEDECFKLDFLISHNWSYSCVITECW